MDNTYQNTVGEVVADDFRTAAVFEKHGIDFCCKGNTPVAVACEKKNIHVEEVMQDIKKLQSNATEEGTDYKTWSVDKLIDQIEEKHHRYVEEKTPVILQFLNKLCKVHGERHPELHAIFETFSHSAADLAQHMKKEELILFPRIKKLAFANKESFRPGMVFGPIETMMQEHEMEGDRFAMIAELSNNYEVPADGCTTYRVAFAMLKEFEQDLHLHIHLENNLLFPKAMKMEKELLN